MNAGIQDTLLDLFQQVSEDPEHLPALPIDAWQEDSQERHLLIGFRTMLERIQQHMQNALLGEERFSLAVQGANDGLWDWDLHTDITERKQAEEQLREKEAQYRSIFEASSDGLFVSNLEDGHVVEINPAACKMLGYTYEELLGLHPTTFIHPDSHHVFAESLQTIKTGGQFQGRGVNLRKDGTPFHVEVHSTAFTYKGKPHILGVVRDITEQMQAEEQLREKEAQYRSIFEATTDALFINNMDGLFVEANPAACRMHGYTYEEFIGHYPTMIGHPDYHHFVAEFFQTIIRGGQYHTRAVNVRKDGTAFPVEVRGAAFTYKGKPHTLAIVRDITEQVQAQHLLEQRVEERTRELSTLLEVSHNVASTLELKPLLDLILDQLKAVADCTDSSILIVEGEELVIVANRGPNLAEQVRHLRFPLKRLGLMWEMLCRREPVIIDNVRDDTPLAQAYRHLVGELLETIFSYTRALMGIPLTLKERVIGTLVLTSREASYFTPRHAALALAIANQVAVAIENARLYEQAQELAALEERQRLARELHDSVSQALYGISLGAHTARAMLERDPRQVAEPLDYVLSLAGAALVEMRALIFELRPESLETEGLVSALTRQAASLHARHGIAVSTDLCDEPDLPLKAKQDLYRIVQEAMHNTVKHAHASRVDLRLDWTSEGVMLEVRDNGVGFDATASFPGHLGLHSIRERVTNIGGTVQIESTPGAGTRIGVRIPGRA